MDIFDGSQLTVWATAKVKHLSVNWNCTEISTQVFWWTVSFFPSSAVCLNRSKKLTESESFSGGNSKHSYQNNVITITAKCMLWPSVTVIKPGQCPGLIHDISSNYFRCTNSMILGIIKSVSVVQTFVIPWGWNPMSDEQISRGENQIYLSLQWDRAQLISIAFVYSS